MCVAVKFRGGTCSAEDGVIVESDKTFSVVSKFAGGGF